MGEPLGDRSVAEVRGDEDIIALVVDITGMLEAAVRSALEMCHGRTQVRNALHPLWPTAPRQLGSLRVKAARECGLHPEIAKVTGLSERTVIKRLAGVHGATTIARLFEREWPSEADDEDAVKNTRYGVDDDDDRAADGQTRRELPMPLGDRSVADVRGEENAVELIAEVTGFRPTTVRRRLDELHGRTLVRNAFDQSWPLTVDQLAPLRVKLARECGLHPEIAEMSGLEEQVVIELLHSVHGATTIGRLLAREAESQREGSSDEESRCQEDGFEGDDSGVCDDDSDSDVASDIGARLGLDDDAAWSRPRKLSRIMRVLGMEVPIRLRSTRFQEVIRALDEAGIQACLDGDEQLLTTSDQSPGIGARVRLRRHRAPSHRPPPIVIVSSAGPHASPQPPAALAHSGYETALVRLRFLTAVPSMTREHDPRWPDGYLDAAAANLQLAETERKLLRLCSASYVRGSHNPLQLIPDLLRGASIGDVEQLIDQFRWLNQDAPAEALELIVGEVRSRMLGATPPFVVRPVETGSWTRAPVAAAPARPSPPPDVDTPAPNSNSAQQPAANVRELGALGDMFDD